MTAQQQDGGGTNKKQHPTTPAQYAKKIEQRGVGREREMETGGQANRQEHTSEWLPSASASVHAHTPKRKRKRKNTRKSGDADVPRSGNTNALGRSSERNVFAPDLPIERAASCLQRGVVDADAIQRL